MLLRRLHPRRSARTAMLHLFSELLLPAASRGSVAWKPFRSRASSVSSNPALLDWMPPARDRLTHTGWAFAYPSVRTVLELNRLQPPPWTVSSLAYESRHES